MPPVIPAKKLPLSPINAGKSLIGFGAIWATSEGLVAGVGAAAIGVAS